MSATVIRIGPSPCFVLAAWLPIGGGTTLERNIAVGPFWDYDDMHEWGEIFVSIGSDLPMVRSISCEAIDLRRLPNWVDELVNPYDFCGQPHILQADLPLILRTRGLPVRRIQIRSQEAG